jgi:hypothetical protein
MVRYSFLVRLSHPLLHAGLSRRLLDHFIRSIQQGLRDRHADLLGRFQIDHQLKPLRLLDRKVGGFRSLQDLIYVLSRAAYRSGRAQGLDVVGNRY